MNPDFLKDKEVFLRKDIYNKDFLNLGVSSALTYEWPFIPDKVVRKVIDVDTSDNTFRTDDGYWISLTKIEGLVKGPIDYSKEEDFLLVLI
jgi:hypothetical protein